MKNFEFNELSANRNLMEETMLKDYLTDKPIFETDRLIIRALNDKDVADLKVAGER